MKYKIYRFPTEIHIYHIYSPPTVISLGTIQDNRTKYPVHRLFLMFRRCQHVLKSLKTFNIDFFWSFVQSLLVVIPGLRNKKKR